MSYTINKKQVEDLKNTINRAMIQYETFCASGCSVHEFNRLKENARGWINYYENGKGEHYLEYATNAINDLLVWIGKRINIVNTNNCINCGIEKYGDGWRMYCRDCDKYK